MRPEGMGPMEGTHPMQGHLLRHGRPGKLAPSVPICTCHSVRGLQVELHRAGRIAADVLRSVCPVVQEQDIPSKANVVSLSSSQVTCHCSLQHSPAELLQPAEASAAQVQENTSVLGCVEVAVQRWTTGFIPGVWSGLVQVEETPAHHHASSDVSMACLLSNVKASSAPCTASELRAQRHADYASRLRKASMAARRLAPQADATFTQVSMPGASLQQQCQQATQPAAEQQLPSTAGGCVLIGARVDRIITVQHQELQAGMGTPFTQLCVAMTLLRYRLAAQIALLFSAAAIAMTPTAVATACSGAEPGSGATKDVDSNQASSLALGPANSNNSSLAEEPTAEDSACENVCSMAHMSVSGASCSLSSGDDSKSDEHVSGSHDSHIAEPSEEQPSASVLHSMPQLPTKAMKARTIMIKMTQQIARSIGAMPMAIAVAAPRASSSSPADGLVSNDHSSSTPADDMDSNDNGTSSPAGDSDSNTQGSSCALGPASSIASSVDEEEMCHSTGSQDVSSECSMAQMRVADSAASCSSNSGGDSGCDQDLSSPCDSTSGTHGDKQPAERPPNSMRELLARNLAGAMTMKGRANMTATWNPSRLDEQIVLSRGATACSRGAFALALVHKLTAPCSSSSSAADDLISNDQGSSASANDTDSNEPSSSSAADDSDSNTAQGSSCALGPASSIASDVDEEEMYRSTGSQGVSSECCMSERPISDSGASCSLYSNSNSQSNAEDASSIDGSNSAAPGTEWSVSTLLGYIACEALATDAPKSASPPVGVLVDTPAVTSRLRPSSSSTHSASVSESCLADGVHGSPSSTSGPPIPPTFPPRPSSLPLLCDPVEPMRVRYEREHARERAEQRLLSAYHLSLAFTGPDEAEFCLMMKYQVTGASTHLAARILTDLDGAAVGYTDQVLINQRLQHNWPWVKQLEQGMKAYEEAAKTRSQLMRGQLYQLQKDHKRLSEYHDELLEQLSPGGKPFFYCKPRLLPGASSAPHTNSLSHPFPYDTRSVIPNPVLNNADTITVAGSMVVSRDQNKVTLLKSLEADNEHLLHEMCSRFEHASWLGCLAAEHEYQYTMDQLDAEELRPRNAQLQACVDILKEELRWRRG